MARSRAVSSISTARGFVAGPRRFDPRLRFVHLVEQAIGLMGDVYRFMNVAARGN